MGGRGAGSGLDPYPGRGGKMFRYGEEYMTIHQDRDIKYVRPRDSGDSVRVPEETRNPDRIYATIDKQNRVKYITYYDSTGKKAVQIDLLHEHGGLRPHAHDGVNHAEGRKLTPKELHDVKTIVQSWENYNGKH